MVTAALRYSICISISICLSIHTHAMHEDATLADVLIEASGKVGSFIGTVAYHTLDNISKGMEESQKEAARKKREKALLLQRIKNLSPEAITQLLKKEQFDSDTKDFLEKQRQLKLVEKLQNMSLDAIRNFVLRAKDDLTVRAEADEMTQAIFATTFVEQRDIHLKTFLNAYEALCNDLLKAWIKGYCTVV